MTDESIHDDAEDRIARMRREHAMMKGALGQIASMVAPEDMEEDEDGFTEWGLPAEDAIPMAYENCIGIAQAALAGVKGEDE